MAGEILARETLPVMPDENGCLPTAYAYALSELGRPTVPQEVDAAIGRPSGELPSSEHITNLYLWLLEQGYAVQQIFMPDLIDMRKYFAEGSTETYEDYVSEMLTIYGERHREYFETSYTQKVHEADMANRRNMDKVFDPFIQNGQLVESKEEVGVLRIQQLLQSGQVIGCKDADDSNGLHAVVIKRVEVLDSGRKDVIFLDPNGVESQIVGEVVDSLNEVIVLSAGLTVISPAKRVEEL